MDGAAYDAVGSKRCNLHGGIGAVLPYGDAKMHSREVLNVIAGVWVGCKPSIETLLDTR